MKAKTILLLIVFLLCSRQTIEAQRLKKKIEKSIVDIENTFNEVPSDRKNLLEKIASSMVANKDDIRLIDKHNQEISQLAMIWLRTGLIYHDLPELFKIESAGINVEMKPISALATLMHYGFHVGHTRGQSKISYEVKYGSDSWKVYPKPLNLLEPINDKALKIFLEEGAIDEADETNIELLFNDHKTIPRDMLYIAEHINSRYRTKS